MSQFKSGYLIGIEKVQLYYYYLILSDPVFFGCQWSYAFYRTSESLLDRDKILSEYGKGFHALIDFNKGMDEKNICKISEKINTEPYQVRKNSKVRIDKPNGGHEWYILSSEFQILRRQ